MKPLSYLRCRSVRERSTGSTSSSLSTLRPKVIYIPHNPVHQSDVCLDDDSYYCHDEVNEQHNVNDFSSNYNTRSDSSCIEVMIHNPSRDEYREQQQEYQESALSGQDVISEHLIQTLQADNDEDLSYCYSEKDDKNNDIHEKLQKELPLLDSPPTQEQQKYQQQELMTKDSVTLDEITKILWIELENPYYENVIQALEQLLKFCMDMTKTSQITHPFAKNGGYVCILYTMNKWYDQCDIQEYCTMILYHSLLGMDCIIHTIAIQVNTISTLLDTMNEFIEYDVIQLYSLLSILTLFQYRSNIEIYLLCLSRSKQDDSICDIIDKNDIKHGFYDQYDDGCYMIRRLIGTIVTAMKNFPNNKHIQLFSCWILKQIDLYFVGIETIETRNIRCGSVNSGNGINHRNSFDARHSSSSSPSKGDNNNNDKNQVHDDDDMFQQKLFYLFFLKDQFQLAIHEMHVYTLILQVLDLKRLRQRQKQQRRLRRLRRLSHQSSNSNHKTMTMKNNSIYSPDMNRQHLKMNHKKSETFPFMKGIANRRNHDNVIMSPTHYDEKILNDSHSNDDNVQDPVVFNLLRHQATYLYMKLSLEQQKNEEENDDGLSPSDTNMK